ncbi:hypothetical protein HF576_07630 [Microbacterium sp. CFH 90308]|uniref:Uncharacterized protein n=1 Tax=Microbacterium salsuginis TaxID=2722803 RepID=A0ABX1K9M3_9MICO|nr:hypothetical protein [Microbacterium sp. CFH 90308]NLP83713.1 hypothetical protein [Microbacterium sp. CFH 90308]
MTMNVDALLAGPRGRRLCFEFAMACARRGTPDAQDAATAVAWAVYALGSGTLAQLFGDVKAERFVPPTVSPSQAAEAFATIPLQSPSRALLRDALADSVGNARYWQEADGADRLAAEEDFSAPLRRVAEVIASGPDAGWWLSPVDERNQWATPREGGGRPPAELGAELAAWRRHVLDDDVRAAAERPADVTANWSGEWWSTPPFGLVRTSRAFSDDGPAGLWFVEDSLGGDDAVALPVDAYPSRVIEIRSPEDWADLCRRHPLDVTASRRHDWYRVTGRDGRWVIPDWSGVATEADGVHLTVTGYLSAATRSIDLDGSHASVLAGWNPDETYWFRGVSARPADQERWRRDDGVWRRERD